MPISIHFVVKDDEPNSREKAVVTTECRIFGFLDVDYITSVGEFGTFLYEHRKIDLVPIQISHCMVQSRQIIRRKIKEKEYGLEKPPYSFLVYFGHLHYFLYICIGKIYTL